MGVYVTVEFKSGNTVLETRSFQGEYTNWWKRASTFGHPATSRPFGLYTVFNLAHVNTGLIIHTEGNHYAEGSYNGTPSQISVDKYGLIPYSGTINNTAEIITAPPFEFYEYGQRTYKPNSGVHINTPTQNSAALQRINGYGISGLRENIFLFSSGGSYYLCYLQDNHQGYYKELGPMNPDDLNDTLSRYFGYGDGNYLQCEPGIGGWTYFATNYYIINPTAYTHPMNIIEGIACIDNPNYANAVLFYDPVTDNVFDSFNIYMQGWVQLSYLVDYNYFGNWHANSQCGICYVDMNNYQFVIPNRGELNLYVGDHLYKQTNANDLFRFNGNFISTINVDTQYTFNFGAICCIGQPTFIDIGEGFYLGRTFFSPFIDVQSAPVYWNDGWSVIGLSDEGYLNNFVAQCDMSYYENQPAGTDTIVTHVTLE